MLSKWVLSTYELLLEISLWVFLIGGGMVGTALGAILGHGFLGFVVGAAIAFFSMAVFLGAVLSLGKILAHVRRVEELLENDRPIATGRAERCARASIAPRLCRSWAGSPREPVMLSCDGASPAQWSTVCDEIGYSIRCAEQS